MNTPIRAAALAGYEVLAMSLGLDVAQQLGRVGLSTAALRDPQTIISWPAMVELLECSATDASCRDLGLRLSRRLGIDILGPVAIAIEHAVTLQDAVDFAAHYIVVHSPSIRIHVDAIPGRSDVVDLCFAIELAANPPAMQAVELALGAIVNCLRLLGQGQVEPVLILLPHARLASPEAYAEALGTACSFEHARAAVRLEASDLSRPLPRGNPMLRKLAQAYLDMQLTAAGQAVADRVRLLVGQLLGTGRATHEVVSRMLAVHPRTMQRRLGDEGTTFEKIKDEVRRALIQRIIERPQSHPLAAVAGMLDYADPSALTRSCHRWFGASPSVLRRQAAQAPSDL